MSGSAPPLAAVIGCPIGHSRSPRLHGHWLRRYGIAGHYVPVELRPESLAEGLRALRLLGFRGANVTIPHKVAVLDLAASTSPIASRVGAANTLTFLDGGGFHADNTDAYGFVASLRQAAPGWKAAAGPALVFGAGGAARAVVAALIDAGAPLIRLANRTPARAEALRAHFLDSSVVLVEWTGADAAAEGAATIVNTTSLGMTGQPALPFRLDAAPAGALVADLVYQPLDTPLLAEARARGLTAVDGLGMLLHQAVPGFEAWFGRRPEVDAELRAAVLER
jgi:shikimate dehydrogenase